MLEYIENLKQKPVHIRKRFAFTVAFSFSTLVLLGWLASYSVSSSPTLANKNNSVETPVSALTASAGSLWGDLKSFFGGSNKAEYSSEGVFEIEGGGR